MKVTAFFLVFPPLSASPTTDHRGWGYKPQLHLIWWHKFISKQHPPPRTRRCRAPSANSCSPSLCLQHGLNCFTHEMLEAPGWLTLHLRPTPSIFVLSNVSSQTRSHFPTRHAWIYPATTPRIFPWHRLVPPGSWTTLRQLPPLRSIITGLIKATIFRPQSSATTL